MDPKHWPRLERHIESLGSLPKRSMSRVRKYAVDMVPLLGIVIVILGMYSVFG